MSGVVTSLDLFAGGSLSKGMQLAQLVATSEALAGTRSRGRKQGYLAQLLETASPQERPLAVSYLMGELPQGKIGLGYAAVREVEHSASPVKESRLHIHEVQEALERIAEVKGTGSVKKRAELLMDLFGRATAAEQNFLRRLLLGELRQGALAGVMVEAIARAGGLEPGAVRRAFMLAGNLSEVAAVALQDGEAGLARYRMELFRPLLPMLAQTGDSVRGVLSRLGPCAFEHKLDGARVLVHREGERVVVFSRRGNDVTEAVPEVVAAVRTVKATHVILDGEALALRSDGRPQPFQVTMRRFGRRLDVNRLRRELPLGVYFFDCLYRNGRELIDAPLQERRKHLDEVVSPEHRVAHARILDEEAGEAFLAEALRAGHEGVLAKSLEAPYEAGRRGAGWLKLKPAHTVDLVVLAAEWGSGRRRGWLSNLHLGARDEGGDFVMLGKTFKGMTDAMLSWQTEALQRMAIEERAGVLYVRPELVVEIAFDGLQKSPHYPGGLALRFARVKAHRPDKRPDEAESFTSFLKWAEDGAHPSR